MGLLKGLFKRKLEIPEELQKTTDMIQYEDKLLSRIANYIDVKSWKGGVKSCTVEAVTTTRRLREMVEKFGSDNLEITRTVEQVSENCRSMEVTYRLSVLFQKQVFRVMVVVCIQATSRNKKFTSIYDNQLQDMCNTICMLHLKSYYPYLYRLFKKCIEEPVIENVEKRIHEKIRYRINQLSDYAISGINLVKPSEKIIEISGNENTPIGELIGQRILKE